MSNIAQELESAMSTLDIEAAKRLEEFVRTGITRAVAEADEWEEIMALMRKRKPEIAHLIGSLADVEFEIAPELPMPPAKIW